jgi:hypothetical protein
MRSEELRRSWRRPRRDRERLGAAQCGQSARIVTSQSVMVPEKAVVHLVHNDCSSVGVTEDCRTSHAAWFASTPLKGETSASRVGTTARRFWRYDRSAPPLPIPTRSAVRSADLREHLDGDLRVAIFLCDYFRANSFVFASAGTITRSPRLAISSSFDLYWWGSSDVGQHGDRPCEILIGRLLEIKQDRQVITLAKFVANRVENNFTLRREPAKNQHHLLTHTLQRRRSQRAHGRLPQS